MREEGETACGTFKGLSFCKFFFFMFKTWVKVGSGLGLPANPIQEVLL